MAAQVAVRNSLSPDLRIAAVSAVIVGCCILASVGPGGASVRMFGFRFPELCGFKFLTGFDCPGCGITRALIYAFHGHFQESYLMHIWGIPLALVLLFQIPYRLLLTITRRTGLLHYPASVSLWTSRVILISILVPWILKTTMLLNILLR